MKATGIVRRIDDLGRVVIPKEIRRTLRIREGDPLEIFTDRDGEVILKKYSPISELGQFAKEYAETLYETLGTPALISDRDEMIAVSGLSKKDYLNRQLSPDVEEILTGRTIVTEKLEKAVEWVPGQVEQVKSYCIAPIVAAEIQLVQFIYYRKYISSEKPNKKQRKPLRIFWRNKWNNKNSLHVPERNGAGGLFLTSRKL